MNKIDKDRLNYLMKFVDEIDISNEEKIECLKLVNRILKKELKRENSQGVTLSFGGLFMGMGLGTMIYPDIALNVPATVFVILMMILIMSQSFKIDIKNSTRKDFLELEEKIKEKIKD